MKKQFLFNISMLLAGAIATLLAPSASAKDIYINLSDEDTITISSESISHVDIVVGDQGSGVLRPSKQIEQLPFNQAVISAAQATNLDPALIHAVIHVESRHNPKALSPKGAFGLMQLMPATAARFNASNKSDYNKNILAGSQYLSELLTLFDENLSLALAAYNAGPGAVKKYNNRIPPYAETAQYVPKVLKYYEQYSK